MPTRLILVRHGESLWNVAGRIQGQTHSVLTDRGRRQAERVAAAVADRGVSRIYTSDLRRAYETANIIGEALGVPVVPDARWREIGVGDWVSLPSRDLRDVRRYRLLADLTLARNLDVRRSPSGETFREVMARVWGAATYIASAHPGETVLVVTHGAAVVAMLARVSLSHGERPEWRGVRNCSITEFSFGKGDWHLELFNAIEHLDGLGNRSS